MFLGELAKPTSRTSPSSDIKETLQSENEGALLSACDDRIASRVKESLEARVYVSFHDYVSRP